MEKKNTPASGVNGSRGAVCLLAGDTDAYTAEATRCQYLTQRGIPFNWTRLVAGLAFGELRHG